MTDRERDGFGARLGSAAAAMGRLLAPMMKSLGKAIVAAAKGLGRLAASGFSSARERMAKRDDAAESEPQAAVVETDESTN